MMLQLMVLTMTLMLLLLLLMMMQMLLDSTKWNAIDTLDSNEHPHSDDMDISAVQVSGHMTELSLEVAGNYCFDVLDMVRGNDHLHDMYCLLDWSCTILHDVS